MMQSYGENDENRNENEKKSKKSCYFRNFDLFLPFEKKNAVLRSISVPLSKLCSLTFNIIIRMLLQHLFQRI